VSDGQGQGNNPNVRPPDAPKFDKAPVEHAPTGGMTVSGQVVLTHPMVIDGLLPVHVPDRKPMQIVAALPDGHVEPLLWLYEYKNSYRHPFLFRRPVQLPAGTAIRGVIPPATIRLLETTR
jgi:hypothetical protein